MLPQYPGKHPTQSPYVSTTFPVYEQLIGMRCAETYLPCRQTGSHENVLQQNTSTGRSV